MTELPKAEKLGYSIAEACAASSLGRTTLYSHIAAGRLQVVRVGGRTIVPVENLRALIGGSLAAATPVEGTIRGVGK